MVPVVVIRSDLPGAATAPPHTKLPATSNALKTFEREPRPGRFGLPADGRAPTDSGFMLAGSSRLILAEPPPTQHATLFELCTTILLSRPCTRSHFSPQWGLFGPEG